MRREKFMTNFIPGLELNRAFYREAVAPILAAQFPHLLYSAGLIGYGSDVLGYDSARSTDHGWGPRLQMFLDADVQDENVHRALSGKISDALTAHLPTEFRGYSTSFSEPDSNGVRCMEEGAAGHVRHNLRIQTLRDFTKMLLGIEPRQQLSAIDWLLIPQQKLLEVTSGEVFHDGLGELGPLREQLQWYPHDVWLLMIAAAWMRIAQDEHFVSRCGEAGDELGSQLGAARIVRDLMRLCFLMERRYAPYAKWFGTGFSRLKCASELRPILEAAMNARTWQDRERHLCDAYEAMARMHNSLGIGARQSTACMKFYQRPYRVLGAGRFAKAVSDAIVDKQVKRIFAAASMIGAIDQFVDNTNLLGNSDLRVRLKSLFDAPSS